LGPFVFLRDFLRDSGPNFDDFNPNSVFNVAPNSISHRARARAAKPTLSASSLFFVVFFFFSLDFSLKKSLKIFEKSEAVKLQM
jgi:hypothetical protein